MVHEINISIPRFLSIINSTICFTGRQCTYDYVMNLKIRRTNLSVMKEIWLRTCIKRDERVFVYTRVVSCYLKKNGNIDLSVPVML